jgi:serine/threonine protein phosphatase PrpC
MDDPQAASKTLVEYALSHGSQDNVTVIVIRLRPVPDEARNASTDSDSG